MSRLKLTIKLKAVAAQVLEASGSTERSVSTCGLGPSYEKVTDEMEQTSGLRKFCVGLRIGRPARRYRPVRPPLPSAELFVFLEATAEAPAGPAIAARVPGSRWSRIESHR
jgi:hypothetical protein